MQRTAVHFLTTLVLGLALLACGAEEEPKTFGSFDGNGDEEITLAEWVEAGELGAAVVDFDENSDGSLNADEFAAFQAFEDYAPCDVSHCPSDQCNSASCQGGKGACVMDALYGQSCNDGDICTTNEYCLEDGVCGVTGDGGISGTEFCGFDEFKVGKSLGDHVKNFAMKTPDDCPYYLHQSCGTGAKVLWVILGTGW